MKVQNFVPAVALPVVNAVEAQAQGIVMEYPVMEAFVLARTLAEPMAVVVTYARKQSLDVAIVPVAQAQAMMDYSARSNVVFISDGMVIPNVGYPTPLDYAEYVESNVKNDATYCPQCGWLGCSGDRWCRGYSADGLD
jgi:hypothetical protein